MRFENNWSLLGLCALLGPKAGGVDMALLSLVFLLVAIFLGFFRKMNTGLGGKLNVSVELAGMGEVNVKVVEA